MNIQAKIQEHYKDRLTKTSDDHMHIGGKKATIYFAEKMGFKPGQTLLDVGCGLGGPARFVAETYDVSVTGVDLSPDNINGARALSAGLSLHFDVTDGKNLPYEDSSFDSTMVLHVGMNVPEKSGFYKEIARILKPGGRLGVYDIMLISDERDLRFPLPWASTSETSFLESPEAIEAYIKQAGFTILLKENRSDFAKESLHKLLTHPDLAPPPERRSIFENLLHNIESGLCSPYIFIAERMG
ncbi:MAG: class I SAM-dependent methyltransferase [Alphaproteobacteria bacterium]|nr:class I SAM-dependent methyltransferase [Alphaproteobacteria bacterium]